MSSAVVLAWRELDGRPPRTWSWRKAGLVIAGVALLVVMLGLAMMILITSIHLGLDVRNPTHWPQLWASSLQRWAQLGAQAVAAPTTNWVEPALSFLFIPAALIISQVAKRRTLRLTDEALTMASGLPAWLDRGSWGSWTVRWQDIAGVTLRGLKPGQVHGPDPLRQTLLQFQLAGDQPPVQLWVAHWYRVGEGARPQPQSPRSWLARRLGSWTSSEDQATVQSAYDALPLVAELRRRGVLVPALAQSKNVAGGVDLFEQPRMKALIIAAMALGLLFFVGAFLPREFWLQEPTMAFWVGLGLAAALIGWAWMRQPNPVNAPTAFYPGPGQPSEAAGEQPVWGYQVLVSLLFGLSVAASSYPALPLFNQMVFPAQDVVYRVDAAARLERLTATSAAPGFKPIQIVDFWLSRKPGAQYTLQMRQLPLGYWQYSVELIRPEIDLFEASLQR